MTHKTCSPACAEQYGIEVALKNAEKQKRKEAKDERLHTKERKEALKTTRDLIKEVQTAFNAFIRKRDCYELCISCNTTLLLDGQSLVGGAFDCGHYRSVGSAPHLRFHENNAHGQCKKCNRWGAGRAVDYRLGLITRIGINAVEILEADQIPKHYSREDLYKLRSLYKSKLKALEYQRGN
jgi:hypothetical protein